MASFALLGRLSFLSFKHRELVWRQGTEAGDMDSGLFEILFPVRQIMRRLTGFVFALPGDSTRQIEHMEFDRGMTQQMREVPESLGVL